MGFLDWFFSKKRIDDDIRQFLKLDGNGRLRKIIEWSDKGDDA